MPRLIDQGVNLIKYSFKKKYLLNLCTEKQEVTLTKKVPSQYKIWTNSPKRAKRSQCKQYQILWIGKTMQGLKVSEVWKLVPVPLLTWWSRRLSRGSRVLQEPTSRWGKSDSRNKRRGSRPWGQAKAGETRTTESPYSCSSEACGLQAEILLIPITYNNEPHNLVISAGCDT